MLWKTWVKSGGMGAQQGRFVLGSGKRLVRTERPSGPSLGDPFLGKVHS